MAIPKLLTLAEVADLTGMHRGSMRKRLSQGRSDGILIGGIWLFTPAQAARIKAEVKPHRKRKIPDIDCDQCGVEPPNHDASCSRFDSAAYTDE